MALTRTPEPLNPRDSAAAYQSSVLQGGRSGQPLPRTVMQSTVPKVPYPAKSGSGSMPTGDAGGIFNVIRPQSSGSFTRSGAKMTKPKSSGGGGVGTGYGNGGYSSAKGPVGARGAYGLEAKAGARLQALQGAYRKQFGQDLSVISGGRSYQEQVKLYNAWKAGKGNLAAKPGTSLHESGRAVDFGGAAHSGGTAQHQWLAANAPKFGWHWAGKNFGEAWHFEAMY